MIAHTIPNISDDEAHQTEYRKLVAAKAELAQLIENSNGLLNAMAAERGSRRSDHGDNIKQKKRDEFDARAMATIDGDAEIAVDKVASLREEYNAMIDRRRLLERAIELQTKRVGVAHSHASQQAVTQIKPQYTKIVRDVSTKLKALEAALKEEAKFRSECDASGFALFGSQLEPMNFLAVSVSGDDNGHFDAWRNRAKEAGHIA